jgi:subtilisin family serine protease
MQWSEPWYGVTTDLDLYLIDSSNNIVASSYYDNIDDEPFEYVDYTNSSSSSRTFRIVINRYTDSGTPRLKYVFLQNGDDCITAVQYGSSSGGDIVGPSITGHSSSVDGFSVAAAPYDDLDNPEYYTSRGPATHYYGPVSGTTPASAITAQVINQPDFAAIDGGCTSFFGTYDSSSACYRFYGTSAAAPHAAAVAALLKQKADELSVTLSRSVAKDLLQSTARTVSGGDEYSVGAGLVDANAAIAALLVLEPVVRVKDSVIVDAYTLIQDAYDDSSGSGDILKALQTTFTEDLEFVSDKAVTLKGGYASGFGSQDGYTTLKGSLFIRGGSAVIENLIIK